VPRAEQLRRRIAYLTKRIERDQAEILMWEEALRKLETIEAERPTLKRPSQSGNTGKDMVNAARVRISGGKGEGDPFVSALNASNFTMRSLAERLGVSHALLSQARTGKISISAELASRIEELTGFKASRKNWPKLRD